jgi:hypothetical protein
MVRGLSVEKVRVTGPVVLVLIVLDIYFTLFPQSVHSKLTHNGRKLVIPLRKNSSRLSIGGLAGRLVQRGKDCTDPSMQSSGNFPGNSPPFE